jgi:hypothetical protein
MLMADAMAVDERHVAMRGAWQETTSTLCGY